jgi:hypothetical protein
MPQKSPDIVHSLHVAKVQVVIAINTQNSVQTVFARRWVEVILVWVCPAQIYSIWRSLTGTLRTHEQNYVDRLFILSKFNIVLIAALASKILSEIDWNGEGNEWLCSVSLYLSRFGYCDFISEIFWVLRTMRSVFWWWKAIYKEDERWWSRRVSLKNVWVCLQLNFYFLESCHF